MIQEAAVKMEKRLKTCVGTILGTVDSADAIEEHKRDQGGKRLKE